MLILYRYQRLFLFSLFYSGRSDHPLLAIHTSELLSKPNTSPSTLIIIQYLVKKINGKILTKKAKNLLVKFVSKYPDSYEGHKLLAEVYEKEGGMRKAFDEYVMALDIKGNEY